MQPKVSVIIPIYNVEKYLEEAIESVINQTLKEIEIILINDGSTDNSLVIAEEYKNKDKRIKIFNQVNQGQSIARNKGIEESNGKYIYFMDSDDYIELNTLEKCYNLCEEHSIELVYFEAESFPDESFNGKINFKAYLKSGKIEEKQKIRGIDFVKKCISKNIYTVPPYLYFTKKEVIDNLRFFPRIYHEDDLFTTLLLLKIKNMIFISEKFYKRRYRKNSTMTQKVSLKHIESRFIIIQELKKILLEESKYEEIIKWLLKNEINNLISASLLSNLDSNKFLKKIVQDEKKYLPIKSRIKIKLKKIYIFYYQLKNQKNI